MSVLLIAAALAASPLQAQVPVARPANAPSSTSPNTLNEITTRGMVITQQGYDITIAFSSDGAWTAAEGLIRGTWRIEGDRLCSASNLQPRESCLAYPKGLKSGDSFDTVSPEGVPTHVRIL